MTEKDKIVMKRFKKLVDDYTQSLIKLANLQHKIYNIALPYIQEHGLDDYQVVRKCAYIANKNKELVDKILHNENVQDILTQFEAEIEKIKVR